MNITPDRLPGGVVFYDALTYVRSSTLMTSNDRLLPAGTRRLNGGQMARMSSVGDEVVTEKWPVWLRLVVIIGLSASLWACIIFAFLAILP